MPEQDITDLVVRPIEGLDELAAVAELLGESGSLPLLATLIHEGGGVTLGAFGNGQLVGASSAVIGLDPGPVERIAASRLKLVVHGLRVADDYRQRGVGRQLMLGQLAQAEQLGLRLITWGFDPLNVAAARLSLSTLGAIAREYDYLPPEVQPASGLLPTDRLMTEWWPTKPRTQQRLAGTRKRLTARQYLAGGMAASNPAVRRADGLLTPSETVDVATRPLVMIEVPAAFAAIVAQDPVLAEDWRGQVRRVLGQLLAVGFIVTDFLFDADDPHDVRAYYVLSQGNASLG